jgi:hypothetical protein
MNEAGYMFIHGWVDDVVRDATVQEAHRIRLWLADGQIEDLSLGRIESPVRLGDEISVVAERARPGRVLVLVDHTTGEGTNFLRLERHRWPVESDGFIAATAGSFAVTLGWGAVPATLAFALLFWLVAAKLPRMRRSRAAALVDYLMDREYCRWRAGLSREGTTR